MPAFWSSIFCQLTGTIRQLTGETGYLGLQENMEEEIRKGNDVIANAAVPGKSTAACFCQLQMFMEVIRDLNMMRLPLLMKTLIS